MAPDLRPSRRAATLGLLCCTAAWRPARADDGEPDVRAEAPVYLAFEMKVDWSTVLLLQGKVAGYLAKGVKEIHLLISSSGGDVSAAVAGYNVLRALPIKLSTYNLGDVDSAASILFMAGRSRSCSPSSRFLFHQVRASIHDADMTRADLQDRLASVESDTDRIKAIYMENARIDAAAAETLMSQQNWVDPAGAMKLGVVQSIAPLSVPPSSSFIVLPVPHDD